MSSSIAQASGVTMGGSGLSELWARLRFVFLAILTNRIRNIEEETYLKLDQLEKE